MPFEPKGDVAEWELIYAEIRTLNPGEEISYERLSELLGRDFKSSSRGPMERAIKELQLRDSRTLVNVRGKGYRMAAAAEHEELARVHARKSRRQLGKSITVLRSADRTQLSAHQATRLDAMESVLTQHDEMLDRLTRRDAERHQQLQDLRRQTSGEMAIMSDKLDLVLGVLKRNGMDVPDLTDGDRLGAQEVASTQASKS
jgi:hypothetical protein